MFWSFPLDETRVTDYLSMPQWHTVLTGCTWIALTNATCSTSATRILNTWRNSIATKAQYCHEGNSMFWSFPLDQTRVRDYLSIPQWHTLLNGCRLDSFHQCNMLHQCHEDSQHLEKQYCHGGKSNVLATCRASRHEYTLSKHTAVTQC